MSRDVAGIFADIDAFDPDKFIVHLTDDVVFRFGNGEPVIGRAAVKEAVAGFFSTIDSLTHHMQATWDVDDVTVVQAEVEYGRKDGKHVTVPNADILTFDGELVRHWQIYIDLAPVFS
jgi:ketosteroid isomerase-like protein